MFNILFAEMETWKVWVIIAAIVLVVITILGVLIAEKRRKKINDFEKKTGVEYGESQRFSTEENVEKYDQSANATYTKGDIIVGVDETMTAGKKQQLVPGKYTVLTSMEGIESFNIRINGFVREVKHNSVIILGEGDTICPVSHSIVLR